MADRAVLVCGGAGFIGSNFVRLLLRQRPWPVVVLDKLTYAGHRQNLPDDVRVTFVQGDIGDTALVSGLLERHQPAWVVNLAAETHVDRSIDSPEPFVQTNTVGTFRLLEAVRVYWERLTAAQRGSFRFLQVSTDEVYGSIPQGEWATENRPYRPNSPYAASKAAGDHFVSAYHTTYGLPVLLTHCSNNFGPYQYPEKLVPLMVLNALDGRELPIYGDGGNIRDWLYVEDHCHALLRVLERGSVGAQYNVGASNEKTNLEVVDAICALVEELLPATKNEAMCRRGLSSYLQLKRFVADRPGHDRRYALDATRLRQELQWQPQYDFLSGLRTTVRWYAANREWCAAVLAGRYNRERLGLAGRLQPQQE